MNRTGTRPIGDRTISGLVSAAIESVGDEHLQQALKIVGRGKQGLSDIEHLHPFGMRTFPQDKTSDQDAQNGGPKGAPELSILSLGGNQSNTVALPAIDRRFGPQNLAKGETVFHDAFKQFLHFGKDLMKGESPSKMVHQVASPKQQDSGSSGGTTGSTRSAEQKQQNSGRADLKADKQVHVSVSMDKDGKYNVEAEDAATIKAKSITLQAEGCSITMANGKIILKGEIHLGDDGGQLVHRKGDVDSDNDVAIGSATKVYAI